MEFFYDYEGLTIKYLFNDGETADDGKCNL